MKPRRALVFGLAALLLLTCVWLVGGNAWATRREEECDKKWTATFGSLEDLEKKYPKRETNETARRLEELTQGSVFDVRPAVRTQEPRRRDLETEWKRSQGMFDFLSAQIAKPEASIDPPSEDVIRFLEEKRVALEAIESVLIDGPAPAWSFDVSRPESDGPTPNVLGQMRLQRTLMARALTAAYVARHDKAARSLEASWNLNESLRTRAETIPALLGIAVERLEVGVLRKVNVDEDVWRKRLAALDPRTSLLDALNLEQRPKSRRNWRDAALEDGRSGSWLKRAWYLLGRPWIRVQMANYSDLMRTEFSRSVNAPLSDHYPEPSKKEVRSLASILAAISIPNILSSFQRADRLVVDAELTSKILEAKRLRRENRGQWPAAIPGIEASRYPDASWRYETSPQGRMSLAFSRELKSPFYANGPKPVPLSFSSN